MIKNYQRRIENKLIMPALQFMNREKSSGIILAIAVIIALILANSPIHEEYASLLEYHFGFIVNGKPFLNFSVEHWINDGLMSLFFFMVGLELKHEFIGGELKDIKKVTMPIVAAVFGMLVPALIYTAFNFGTDVYHGWGIPMATDIAFALAVLYLLGDRIPLSAKVFLTTLAIVDDLGSVLVIALFYTSEISFLSLGVGLLFLLVMFIGNKMGIKNVWFYGIVGLGGVWVAFLMSGIHATISAVLAAMMIPADSQIAEPALAARLRKQLKRFEQTDGNNVVTLEPEQVKILSRMRTDSENAIPPSQRLEHGLQPFVAFVIIPVFALANAGVSFLNMDGSILFSNHVALGVMFGLLVGKPLGIVLAVWLTEKLGLGKRSRNMTWQRIIGIGFLASIGFTMSMFITMLAFNDPTQHIQAKVGIFAASILGGVMGYAILKKN
ncbi:Na+/H+ antiporter NhaA [Prevotella disiens JCM 6334 = ATCC 29426]|jgi:Na+/H+ antiporter nhaA|uniref:Na(+)/H(+) antiporter NhaA n=2 Tax=Prevotella disiens TaxID=28130 RepID=A0A379DXI0_9BACT|nr:Na+/H+ antiporter NhaA [Prevotella disiens]ERJ79354.1 Na+/H+ antiporter NhaA [Prevotella disiens JCM 6334 = ATCC 29426]SUB84702.1 Sodium/proton antiporter nhaA [Prevotella disiens]